MGLVGLASVSLISFEWLVNKWALQIMNCLLLYEYLPELTIVTSYQKNSWKWIFIGYLKESALWQVALTLAFISYHLTSVAFNAVELIPYRLTKAQYAAKFPINWFKKPRFWGIIHVKKRKRKKEEEGSFPL